MDIDILDTCSRASFEAFQVLDKSLHPDEYAHAQNLYTFLLLGCCCLYMMENNHEADVDEIVDDVNRFWKEEMPFSFTFWVYGAYKKCKEMDKMQFDGRDARDEIDEYRASFGHQIAEYILDDYLYTAQYDILKTNLFDTLDNTLDYISMTLETDNDKYTTSTIKSEQPQFSLKVKEYISNLDAYKTEVLLRDYTDKSVKYLKHLFKEECSKIGTVESEGVECINLFELYCIKCYFPAVYWIFNDHLPKLKQIFVEIIQRELSKEEIEIMWHGHYRGHWFSFAPNKRNEIQSTSFEQMVDDLAESIIMHPALDDDEEKNANEVAERNRLLTLPIFVQERCVLEGLKLPSFALATEMVSAFALLFNNEQGDIWKTTGKTYNLSIAEGSIIPYIKFIGYSVCGRKSDDDSPTIEDDETIVFYEKNKEIFIKLLDASFHNYYLYRYNSLSGYRKNNYLDAVKLLYFETLQELGPQLDDVKLGEERELVITVFAEKADCYTHIFAVYLQGLQGKEVRIRNEIATVFPLLSF